MACEFRPGNEAFRRKAVGFRWAFTRKINHFSEVAKAKARHVAKGLQPDEKHGLLGTFSPTPSPASTALVLAVPLEIDHCLLLLDA